MAGKIAALFGGLLRPSPPAGTQLGEVQPGIGGYSLPEGPAGQSGFPGSTTSTRTFKGRSPRSIGIRADTNVGWESGLSDTPQVRQPARHYGDRQGRRPRQVPTVATPQPELTRKMQQNSSAEWYGGQPLSTQPGYDVAGLNPLSHAEAVGGHSVRATETPANQRQPQISGNVPGANNVRNTIAQRYPNAPGETHTYKSAPRADQARNDGGESGSGLGGISQEVTVENRFVFEGGGVQTWSVLRQMPYTGRGNGARGADLNGQRYYGEFQDSQPFLSGGQGQYGVGRLRGPNHRPTNFQQPAPWSAQYYDTTDSVGTTSQAGTNGQVPNLVYTSPSAGRAKNGTQRQVKR